MASTSLAAESNCNMPTEIHWPVIAVRLVLTLIAGGLLGFERSRTGHAAGLRTTLLVTLAASIAMIQMNLLIPTNGKPPDSYIDMDLMRLPLGILTGVGFIGAGVIVRKDELVIGVTTAATMWFATVVGLCMGGGQLALGSVSTVIGFAVLWGLRYFERYVERYQLAELTIKVRGEQLAPRELQRRLQSANFNVKSLSIRNCIAEHQQTLACQVRWPSRRGGADFPPVIGELERLPGVLELEWKAVDPGAR